LEPGDPGVRYLTMRDLLDLPAADSALHEAQLLAHRKGPIAEVLNNMSQPGYWVESGPGGASACPGRSNTSGANRIVSGAGLLNMTIPGKQGLTLRKRRKRINGLRLDRSGC